MNNTWTLGMKETTFSFDAHHTVVDLPSIILLCDQEAQGISAEVKISGLIDALPGESRETNEINHHRTVRWSPPPCPVRYDQDADPATAADSAGRVRRRRFHPSTTTQPRTPRAAESTNRPRRSRFAARRRRRRAQFQTARRPLRSIRNKEEEGQAMAA